MSAAPTLRVVLPVLGPVPFELPARHGVHVLAPAALQVLVPLGLAGRLLEVPAEPVHGARGARPHPGPACPTSSRRGFSYWRSASFSSFVAKKSAGATRCEGS